jgi:hypothetical protein
MKAPTPYLAALYDELAAGWRAVRDATERTLATRDARAEIEMPLSQRKGRLDADLHLAIFTVGNIWIGFSVDD